MPEWTKPLAANVVGRPGWSCYVAYDGERPAGAGALFVHEGVGWLGFGATLPELRGRGAQSAILAARIEDARKQGCTTVVTETGELEEGRPSNSYRNILRAGFPRSRACGQTTARREAVLASLLVRAAAAAALLVARPRGSPPAPARTPLQIGAVVPELLDARARRTDHRR